MTFVRPLALLLLCAGPALAGDGVIEINQARALAGGVTPGDTPGFPVTLSESSSYLLTSNLSSPVNLRAIVITANNVTLDLGGFVVGSTNVCSGYPVTSCTDTQTFGGGISSQAFLVVVRNGTVQGMADDGINLAGPSNVVESVRVLNCAQRGIVLGGAGRVSHSFSGSNRTFGILLERGSRAFDNEVRGNGSVGLYLTGDLGGSLEANRAWENGLGISVSGPVLVTRNQSKGNLSGAMLLSPSLGAPVSLGDNLCDGVLC